MPSSDERLDNINFFGLALSGGVKEGGGWVPYPEAKNLPPPSLLPSLRPFHPHKGVTNPIYSDWSQELAWKGWGQKAIFHGTKPLQWSHFDLGPPRLHLLQSYQCQLNFVTTQLSSTKGEPFHSEWSDPQQFTPDSALKCQWKVRLSDRASLPATLVLFYPSPHKLKWPVRQRGHSRGGSRRREGALNVRHCSFLPSSLPPIWVTEACSAGMWIISHGALQHQKLGEPLRIQMWGLMVHFINVLAIKAHFTDLGDWLIYTLWEIAPSHA